MKKAKNLQPWLDYFEMLQTYEKKGFLELHIDKHEAYTTLPALHAMTEGENPERQQARHFAATIRRVRAYAGYKSQEGPSYLQKSFALHIVKDAEPHDLLYTVLLESKRKWWNFFMKTDCFDIVEYTKKSDL